MKSSYIHAEDTKLSDKTVCMSAVQGDMNEFYHFDVHNLYGLTQSMASYESLKRTKNSRPYLVSRSTFVGSGQYAGHWNGV